MLPQFKNVDNCSTQVVPFNFRINTVEDVDSELRYLSTVFVNFYSVFVIQLQY